VISGVAKEGRKDQGIPYGPSEPRFRVGLSRKSDKEGDIRWGDYGEDFSIDTRGEVTWKPVGTSWVNCGLWIIFSPMYPPITFWVHPDCDLNMSPAYNCQGHSTPMLSECPASPRPAVVQLQLTGSTGGKGALIQGIHEVSL